MAKRLGIYIHIPFCASKCGYCDFYSLAGCEHLMPEYHQALLAHLKESAQSIKAYEVDSLYFGGGTPSFYGADRIADIFNTLKLNGNVRVDSEVTVECNPDSTSPNALKLLREEGVNRLSIGVQATDNNILKLIGRTTTSRRTCTATPPRCSSATATGSTRYPTSPRRASSRGTISNTGIWTITWASARARTPAWGRCATAS